MELEGDRYPAACGGVVHSRRASRGNELRPCALTAISPKRLVFGTDYPQKFSGDPQQIKTFIENIRKLEIDEDSKEVMLGENARGLQGL